MNYINFFGKSIPTYGLLIVIGLILGNVAAFLVIKKKKLDFDEFILIETYGLAFGAIGAKALYLWISRDFIDWSRFFEAEYFSQLMHGGFVFYGGLVAGCAGVVLAKLIHKIDVKQYLSKLVFCIPLVHGFGRLGCYFAGCCYGIPYNGPFHVVYHNVPYSLCDTNLFPVQLLEAVSLFILAVVFLVFVLKKNTTINCFFGYIMCYCVLRFFLEFLRYDSVRGHLGAFSTSQWISIILFIVLAIKVIYNKTYSKAHYIGFKHS